MTGFTFMWGCKDVFVETSRKNKTEALAGEILQAIGGCDNPANRQYFMYRLQKAECEIRILPGGRKMYEIHGKGFGGLGSFVDDGKTVIIKI